jgi:hypothetical protein
VGNSTVTKTDVWDVECGTGTKSLNASVKGVAPATGPKIGVQLVKNGAYGPEYDPINGDTIYSKWVTAPKGQGHYSMNVIKAAGVAESYQVRFVCVNANNKRTQTQAQIKQND